MTGTTDKPTSAPLTLPADALPVVPTRGASLFPGVVLPLTIGRDESIAAAQEALRSGRRVIVLMQRDPTIDAPRPADLYEIGTTATIVRYVTAPDGTHHLICQGEQRARIKEFLFGSPFPRSTIRKPCRARRRRDRGRRPCTVPEGARAAGRRAPAAGARRTRSVGAGDCRAGELADLVTSFIDATAAEKQDVLETVNVKARLEKVIQLLARRVEVLKITRDIRHQTQEALDQRQKEILLREQMRQIQKELGESDERPGDIAELEKAIEAAGMPAEAAEQARKELKRLARMSEGGPEYSMVRTYLDWLVALPWSKLDPENIDIERARAVLDEEHYRPREDQAPHPRIPRRPQAESGRPQSNPVFRRSARRRQDLARSKHREGDWPQVRAREPRRRAR